MARTDISVIIVTYNGMKWIDKCLRKLSESDIELYPIIIDNGSTDDTVTFIQKNHPSIELIQTNENLGFGRANNIGIDLAIAHNAQYVFLLNQDGYVEPDTISKLVNFHKSHPEYGVLSPKQMNGDGSALDKRFDSIVLSESCILRSYKTEETDVFDVSFVMAAFWLISAACIKKVGKFDPIFFHYGEDGDYLSRVRYHGLKIGVVMESIGYHDRHERIVAPVQQIKGFYASQLGSLTNINRSLAFEFSKVSFYFLKNSFRYLSRFQFKLIYENTKYYSNLLGKMPIVLRSRRQNRIPNS
ncbi:MAG: glycosyltransferase family 2 protein [Mucilaginibacter sp.]|nr:glycosyltransferase family 2 protein [Mucilaginibacter sp.]